MTRPDRSRLTGLVPHRDNGAVLPAALVALLLALALFQLFDPPEPVAAGDFGRVVIPAVRSPAIRPVRADPRLVDGALFARPRGGGDGAPVATGPIGGATPVGIIRARGFARAVLSVPGSPAVLLSVGQSHGGWRLTGIGTDNVQFSRDGRTLRLPLSTQPAADDDSDRSQLADER